LPHGDPVCGGWVRASYVAERDVIAARCTQGELSGPPKMRAGVGAVFTRWK
jgi:hypothetical protein